ncbi:hypothetical protein BDP27DRAFT_1359365 [Rhodocollybia butyracea]|uniref:Uncharacterized protein n=1 Tax=Rhodocollybia butyracea TaxID=206335 RepID=A0A9P5Q4Z5_9AGAR|nr:hypothetical protein BDP27DRAFT_1359365 [Rhodocollybia butyracea]
MSSGPPVLPAEAILGLKVILVDVLVESLWLGVQGVVTIIGIYILWSRGLSKSFGNRFLVGIILFLFCTSTCSLSLTIWDYMNTVLEFNGTYDATPIVNKYFISDSIVVWRAWLLWDRNIFVKMLLVVCLLGTISASFIQGILSVNQQIRQSGGAPIGSGPFTLMFSIPLLFTNLTSTTLIAARICSPQGISLQHHEPIVKLKDQDPCYAINIWGIIPPIGISAIMGSMPYVTAIYPVAVVVLVTLDKNNYGSTIRVTDTTVHFNHPVVTTTTVNGGSYRVTDQPFHVKRLSADHLSSSSEKL